MRHYIVAYMFFYNLTNDGKDIIGLNKIKNYKTCR